MDEFARGVLLMESNRGPAMMIEMPSGIDTQMRNGKVTLLKHPADREHGFVIGRTD